MSGQQVTRIDGDARANAVVTAAGDRIEAELIVAGIGIEPNVALFEDTALHVDRGIIVNECLETNLNGVYAGGDVVRYRDLLFGTTRRADHWDNAVEQGKHIALQLAGDRQPFIHVPYFFSDVFDLSYEYWGDAAGATSVIYRGDVGSSATFASTGIGVFGSDVGIEPDGLRVASWPSDVGDAACWRSDPQAASSVAATSARPQAAIRAVTDAETRFMCLIMGQRCACG